MTRWIRNTTLIASVALIASVQPFRPVMVEGRSMFPTLQDHRLALATKNVGEIQRGDVIVFKNDDENVVKRVAMVAGDSFVEMQYDGYWLMPMSNDAMHRLIGLGQPWHRVTIPRGYVYVIGDNPGESVDSREFGPVPIVDVEMKVVSTERKSTPLEIPGLQLADHRLLARR